MKIKITVKELENNGVLLPGEKPKQSKRITQYYLNLDDYGLIKHFEEKNDQAVELIALELINSCNDLSIYLPIKAFCVGSELLVLLNYFDNSYTQQSCYTINSSDWSYNEIDNN